MTMNTLTPVQMQAARKQYGRGIGIQLLIFVGISAAVLVQSELLYAILMGLINRVLIHSDMVMIDAAMGVYQLILYGVSIAQIFLHRAIVFRSADRVWRNALPLAGFVILGALVSRITSTVMLHVASDWLFSLSYNWNALRLSALLNMVMLLLAASLIVLEAFTIHLVCRKNLLCLLTLAGFIFVSAASAVISMVDSFTMAMVQNTEIRIVVFKVLSFLVNTPASFFALRLLVYRDSWDTQPKVEQRIVQRYLAEHPQEVEDDGFGQELNLVK